MCKYIQRASSAPVKFSDNTFKWPGDRWIPLAHSLSLNIQKQSIMVRTRFAGSKAKQPDTPSQPADQPPKRRRGRPRKVKTDDAEPTTSTRIEPQLDPFELFEEVQLHFKEFILSTCLYESIQSVAFLIFTHYFRPTLYRQFAESSMDGSGPFGDIATNDATLYPLYSNTSTPGL